VEEGVSRPFLVLQDASDKQAHVKKKSILRALNEAETTGGLVYCSYSNFQCLISPQKVVI
jgi:hypothetical protein